MSKLFIDSASGNVGLSINQPTAKLHIQQSGSEDILRLDDEAGDTTPLVVDADGNVGIGTVDPKQTLTVVGTHNSGKDAANGMASGGNLAIKSNAPQIDFIDTEHKDWAIHVNSNKLYFIREPWETTDLVLDGAGNVGIGTDSPGEKLHVTGPIMEQLDIIRCKSRDDWNAQNHPIMQYFKEKLSGKPKGTMIRAIQDNPRWKGHYWQGWVGADSTIRVVHNNHNTPHHVV